MEIWSLVLFVIIGDPETGPLHSFVLDSGSFEDCQEWREEYRPIWDGNNNIGMHCETVVITDLTPWEEME